MRWNIDEIRLPERRSTSSRITAGIIPRPPPPSIERMRKLVSKLLNTEPGDVASELVLRITPSPEITGRPPAWPAVGAAVMSSRSTCWAVGVAMRRER